MNTALKVPIIQALRSFVTKTDNMMRAYNKVYKEWYCLKVNVINAKKSHFFFYFVSRIDDKMID